MLECWTKLTFGFDYKLKKHLSRDFHNCNEIFFQITVMTNMQDNVLNTHENNVIIKKNIYHNGPIG